MADAPPVSGPGGQGPAISQPPRLQRRQSMVLGGLFVLIGAILLAGQFVRVDVGLVLFLLGAAFFEGVIGIGGYPLDHSAGVVLGVLIIALGAAMLVLNLTSSGRRTP